MFIFNPSMQDLWVLDLGQVLVMVYLPYYKMAWTHAIEQYKVIWHMYMNMEEY